jgi:homoserine O-acetyltransferase
MFPMSAKTWLFAQTRFQAVLLVATVLNVLNLPSAFAAEYPAPTPADYTIPEFKFQSGEVLRNFRLHYLTLGTPQADDHGVVTNAVLILHGTTGSCSNFLRAEFAGELFGKGQLLDATRYYLILPDNIGHGHSRKPSEGLRARFPHYGYQDMVEAQYRLVTEALKGMVA